MVMIAVAAATDWSDAPQERDAELVGRVVADLGCDLLTDGGPGAAAEVARSFFLSPYRVGRSIGILPGRAVGIDGQVLGAVSPLKVVTQPDHANPWVEISIRTHLDGEAPKGPYSGMIVGMASADVVIVLAGGSASQAALELAAGLGKPTIVFARAGQKIGQYEPHALPAGTGWVEDELVLRDSLLMALRPLALTRPSFAALRAAYSTTNVHSCSMTFPNTCAIRMSEALNEAVPGIMDKFAQSGLNRCPHGYMRGAQDLASVLRKADVFGTYDQGFSNPGSAPSYMTGKKGIVAYMNIPSFPDGQGHIDLWDGTGPVGSQYWNADPIWFWKLS